MFDDGLSPYLKCIRVSNDGKSVTIDGETDIFKKAVRILDELFCFSRSLAPFSVCLPGEAEKMAEEGLWIELVFSGEMNSHGLTYDALLMRLEKGRNAFTMIRHTGDGYGGRCLSAETEGTADALYEYIENMMK